MNGYKYRCKVSVADLSLPTISRDATLTVVNATAPKITTQPSNKSINAGQTTTFDVNASGNPSPTYQWQVSKDGSSWTNVSNSTPYSGATTNKLTITNAQTSLNNYKYRCAVIVTSGGANLLTTSNEATLTIKSTQSNTAQTSGTKATSFLRTSNLDGNLHAMNSWKSSTSFLSENMDTKKTIRITSVKNTSNYTITLSEKSGSALKNTVTLNPGQSTDKFNYFKADNTNACVIWWFVGGPIDGATPKPSVSIEVQWRVE
jgi:hypothetical protein